MNPALVISPHLDDAVLSLGRFLAGRPDAVVVTVMAGVPSPEEVTDCTTYDRSCGFASAEEAMNVRRTEDLVALSVLHAEPVWLSCLDSQYSRSPAHLAPFLEFLAQPLPEGCDTVLVPLGIKHPDHLDVAATVRQGAVERWMSEGVGVWVYEELPGRVLWPEEVYPAIVDWMAVGLLERGFVGTGSRSAKRIALNKYKSQRPALDVVEGWDISIYAPERVWRLT